MRSCSVGSTCRRVVSLRKSLYRQQLRQQLPHVPIAYPVSKEEGQTFRKKRSRVAISSRLQAPVSTGGRSWFMSSSSLMVKATVREKGVAIQHTLRGKGYHQSTRRGKFFLVDGTCTSAYRVCVRNGHIYICRESQLTISLPRKPLCALLLCQVLPESWSHDHRYDGGHFHE